MSKNPNSDVDSEKDSDPTNDDNPRFTQCEICGKGVTNIKKHCKNEHVAEDILDEEGILEETYPNIFDEIVSEEIPASHPDPDDFSGFEYETESTTSNRESTESAVSEAELDASAGTDGQSDGSSTESANDSSSTDEESTMGNKWYLIGVGGAGNRIVDTILMRRASLNNTQKPLAGVWSQALAGFGLLNANLGDMMNTYYYEEMNNMSENELLKRCVIGKNHDDNDFTGCGQNWDLGREFIEKDFEDGSNPMSPNGRWDIVMDQLGRSQAAMICHSVTGGTGCGSAPVLAREIKDSDNIKRKSVFGTVVIPSDEEDGDGPLVHMNGCVGTARMAKYSDALMIFENDALESLNPELDEMEGVKRYPHYKDMNNALMRYFEIFSMASIDGNEIEGEDFDINDSLEPINWRRPANKDYYSDSDDEFDEPANILAPIIARSRAESLNKTTMQTLAHNALQENLLADFDPTTAWGGTFVFYGPKEKLSGNVNKKEFQNFVLREYLDQDPDESSLVEINTSVINVNSLDSIYLWGFLWNPKVESLEDMLQTAEQYRDTNIRGAEPVQERWNVVEGLFDLLGRENMGG